MAAGGKATSMSNAAVAAALVALLVVAAASGAAGFTLCGVETGTVVKECRSYCRKGSTESMPSGACCAAAAPATNPTNYNCLCQYSGRLSSDIDGTRTMQIPSKCYPGAPTACSH